MHQMADYIKHIVLQHSGTMEHMLELRGRLTHALEKVREEGQDTEEQMLYLASRMREMEEAWGQKGLVRLMLGDMNVQLQALSICGEQHAPETWMLTGARPSNSNSPMAPGPST